MIGDSGDRGFETFIPQKRKGKMYIFDPCKRTFTYLKLAYVILCTVTNRTFGKVRMVNKKDVKRDHGFPSKQLIRAFPAH